MNALKTVTFLHTSDCHLGMRRHFLDEDALPRFVQARIEALGRMARVARDAGCSFVVACGDVWESNQLDPRTVGRAMEAMGSIPCPVYLLPGNHDPYDAGSIYRTKWFAERKPANVHVLASTDPGAVSPLARVQVAPGVEIVGVPLTSKSPLRDLVAEACAGLEPCRPGDLRVCAAHGVVDSLSQGRQEPGQISAAGMQSAISDGRSHFFALGDRHSTAQVGDRIWYSGSPEPTDFRVVDPGNVLVVELTQNACKVTPVRIGRWRFAVPEFVLNGRADVEAARLRLDAMPDKETTVLKLVLEGALSLESKVELDRVLDSARTLFASVNVWDRHDKLVVVPDEKDMGDLGLAGFAKAAFDELRQKVAAGGEDASTARDALSLLYRIANGVKP